MSHPAPTPPFGLNYDAWGHLVLIDAEGRRHVDVEPIRAFPISDPRHYVSICDSAGRELLAIDDLDSLTENVRLLLERALEQREFTPVIQRVLAVSGDTEPAEWTVATDRGETRFVLSSEDDVRRLGDHRVLIADAAGIRYLIPDARLMDHASRRALERYL